MVRLAIFQDDLDLGGIQRSLISFLKALDYTAYEVDLYLFGRTNAFGEQLPKEVNVIYCKKPSKLERYMPFSWYYRITKGIQADLPYDYAVDYNGYQNATAANALKIPAKHRVLWVHSDYASRAKHEKNILKALHSRFMLSKGKWKRFDIIAGVSENILSPFKKDFPEKRFAVARNRIDAGAIIKQSEETAGFSPDPDKVNFCFLGRLTAQKNVPGLLEIFSRVIAARKDARLYIIGDGSERGALEKKAESLNLSEYVTFLGAKANPFPYLKQMDALVLNSHVEGQGIVLWEAKCLGLQLIFPKHLESAAGLPGTDDMAAAMINAEKQEKVFDYLTEYNERAAGGIREIFGV